jgi:hypothetical protein
VREVRGGVEGGGGLEGWGEKRGRKGGGGRGEWGEWMRG